MNCKYCHLKTHNIDKCPTIICKICKDIGHPQWLCKEKRSNKSNANMNTVTNANMNTNTNIKTNIEKKYSFVDTIKKNLNLNSEQVVQKNIKYYLHLDKKLWGDIINI